MLSINNKKDAKKARFLGLDFGSKTIGVALGCPDCRVATGLTTIFRDQEAALRPGIHRIKDYIKEYGITHIVLGYPVHMDGSASPRAEKTLAFRDKLFRNFKSIDIILWDERLSTQAVTKAFYDIHTNGSGASKKKRETYQSHVDEMAAVYILQGYLNKHMEETMENEPIMPDENEEMGDIIMVTDDDGEEHQLHVLASREVDNCVYLLAALAEDEEETSEVLHFKCLNVDENDTDEDDMSLELVDEDHSDLALVMELFKDDYAELGITIDEEDSIFGA